MKTLLLALLAVASLGAEARASCLLLTSGGTPAIPAADPLGHILNTAAECPSEVFAFRALLRRAGLDLLTTMVANRGFHNPAQGSFSLFEMAVGTLDGVALEPGDFFFGHFTAADGGRLVNDQNPERGSLMIEAFAWDFTKGMFNFYELRGNGMQGQWFYRGDSGDIVADNELLHRQPDPMNPRFGNRLRCSACHSAGGPIMKELAPPHNDWWEPLRGLDFGGRTPDARLADMLRGLVPADRLAQAVVLGVKKLESSRGFQELLSTRTLAEQLRPLFCAVEVNFASDDAPNEAGRGFVAVPVEFLADPRLLGDAGRQPGAGMLEAGRSSYENALSVSRSHFPETDLPDGDHAWLAPVKATSDQLAVEALIERGLIDHRFAAAVLAIDFTNPVFSGARCGLLPLLPELAVGDWRGELLDRLRAVGTPPALELLRNLTDPERDLAYHRKRVLEFKEACRRRLLTEDTLAGLYGLLLQRRGEIRASEISKNPLGQILEPGFRVIFPEAMGPAGRSGLDEATCEPRPL